MRKFLVATIAITIANNKVAKFGQEVLEDQLNSPVLDLLKSGAITEVKTKKNDLLKEADLAAKIAVDSEDVSAGVKGNDALKKIIEDKKAK